MNPIKQSASTRQQPQIRTMISTLYYAMYLDPGVVYKQAVEDRTAIKGQFCVISKSSRQILWDQVQRYNLVILNRTVYYCVVAATNLSMRSNFSGGYHRKGNGVFGDDDGVGRKKSGRCCLNAFQQRLTRHHNTLYGWIQGSGGYCTAVG